MARKPTDFEEFCTGVYGRLRGYLTLYCGDAELALDLTQETLARAYRDWRKLRRSGAAEAWVFRIGTNLSHSHYRRKKTERRATALLDGVETPEPPDVGRSIALRRAVRDLPPRQRRALLLRYYADLSVRTIAEEMSCPEGTVKSLLSRGVASLRVALGDQLEEVGNE